MIPDCTLPWIAHDVMAWMRSISGSDDAKVDVRANAVRTCCTDATDTLTPGGSGRATRRAEHHVLEALVRESRRPRLLAAAARHVVVRLQLPRDERVPLGAGAAVLAALLAVEDLDRRAGWRLHANRRPSAEVLADVVDDDAARRLGALPRATHRDDSARLRGFGAQRARGRVHHARGRSTATRRSRACSIPARRAARRTSRRGRSCRSARDRRRSRASWRPTPPSPRCRRRTSRRGRAEARGVPRHSALSHPQSHVVAASSNLPEPSTTPTTFSPGRSSRVTSVRGVQHRARVVGELRIEHAVGRRRAVEREIAVAEPRRVEPRSGDGLRHAERLAEHRCRTQGATLALVVRPEPHQRHRRPRRAGDRTHRTSGCARRPPRPPRRSALARARGRRSTGRASRRNPAGPSRTIRDATTRSRRPRSCGRAPSRSSACATRAACRDRSSTARPSCVSPESQTSARPSLSSSGRVATSTR